MNKNNWILIGIISVGIVALGEFLVDAWLGTQFPGYDWLRQTISYLGQEGSPVIFQIKVWGGLFSSLFLLFAIGFYKAFGSRGRWAIIASILIFMYGLGEGIGSSFFAINPPGTAFTVSAFFHMILGDLGDVGLVLLPFVLFKVFPKKDNSGFFYYSWIVIFNGVLLLSLFFASKIVNPDTGWLSYVGLYQRLYLLNYNIFLIVIAWKMWKARKQLLS